MVGLSSGQVQRKIIKLVFATSRQTALKSKRKDFLAWNHDNVSKRYIYLQTVVSVNPILITIKISKYPNLIYSDNLCACFFFISSPCQRQCELSPSLGIRRLSSVNFSHFNLLLWNPSAKWSETW